MELTAAHKLQTTVPHTGQTSYFAGKTLCKSADRRVKKVVDPYEKTFAMNLTVGEIDARFSGLDPKTVDLLT